MLFNSGFTCNPLLFQRMANPRDQRSTVRLAHKVWNAFWRLSRAYPLAVKCYSRKCCPTNDGESTVNHYPYCTLRMNSWSLELLVIHCKLPEDLMELTKSRNKRKKMKVKNGKKRIAEISLLITQRKLGIHWSLLGIGTWMIKPYRQAFNLIFDLWPGW